MRLPRALLAFLASLFLLAGNAAATWSIVVVNVVTGEVAVGIATCLTGFDLRPNTVVVVPGRGVAAAQSFVGPLSLRSWEERRLLARVYVPWAARAGRRAVPLMGVWYERHLEMPLDELRRITRVEPAPAVPDRGAAASE